MLAMEEPSAELQDASTISRSDIPRCPKGAAFRGGKLDAADETCGEAEGGQRGQVVCYCSGLGKPRLSQYAWLVGLS